MFDSFGLKLTKDELDKFQVQMDKIRLRYANYKDPWGLNLNMIEKGMKALLPLYLHYFKVRIFGQENLEDKPYMMVSNHTGQIPIDGMLTTMGLLYDIDTPRILHGMVDRFVMKLPFLADFYGQSGAILGDRANCNYLIENGESILVFPEGTRGVNKNTRNFYKLQKFSNGFYRIALSKKAAIIPLTVIGAEEMFPLVMQTKFLSKILGLPSIPLSANFIPLPSPIDIYIGKPIEVPDLDPDAPDKEIQEYVSKIEAIIKKQIIYGLKNRRPFLETVRRPLQDFVYKIKDEL